MATVHLDNIAKSWGAVTAVSPLSLDIADGEFLVLLGPSGCGKTTTMRMIAGLDEPTGGTIRIDGRDVTHLEPRDRDVAMVFQNYGLYPHMTVAENIGYPLKLAGVPKAERARRVAEAAERVELTPYLERRPAAMSGGQRQRVALARAIVRQAKLFLMDEPLSNLDAKLRGTMRSTLRALQRDLGITTIYVTHDQVEAMTMADRVVVMEKGRIQQIGTPADVYHRPANLFVAGFLGAPPMNFINGQLSGGVFTAPGMVVPADSNMTRPAILGVRPEAIRLTGPAASMAQGRVRAVEFLGDASLLLIDRQDGGTLTARVAVADAPVVGAPVGLDFTTTRLFAPAADGGQALDD
ncbi:ABC transporter ATP-binding protein [Niveispirillum fermenti]|uniref:ABC transporter ATP-binding protein n=1 Tax=Niveispirillum fermenti TaxID=1233113 RepID=UPI003A8C2C8D